MTGDLHNIDNLFKKAIDGYEEAPSESSWNVIDKQLDKSNIGNNGNSYANLKKIAAILLFLLLGSITHDLRNRQSFDIAKTGATKPGQLIAAVNSNNNSIENNKNESASVINQLNFIKNKPVTTTNIAKQLKSARPAIHNSITNFAKERNSAHSTFIGVADSVNGEVTNSDNNKTSKENNQPDQPVTGSLKTIDGQAVPSSINENIATQSLLPQNNILRTIKITQNSIGQNSKTVIQKTSHFSATILFSPNLPFNRILGDNDHDADDVNKIKKGEHCQSSFSLGALIDYNINKHWSIQSGLTFLNKLNKISPKTIYAQNTGSGDIEYLFNCSSGYSYLPNKLTSSLSVGDSAQALSSTNKLQYIGIPVQVKYTIPKGKFNFNASAGVSFNILTKGNIETEIANNTTKEDEVINKISGLKPGYINGIIGIGAEYKLTRKLAITLAPSMNIALTSITQSAPVKSYPGFVSFAAGLHFNL